MTSKALTFMWGCFFIALQAGAQDRTVPSDCVPPATIILFRTFNFFSFKFSYNLYSGDSLLGRIKTHDVFVVKTIDPGISLHATTKAPSLNADKGNQYQKKKTTAYPVSLQPGRVYFVKCDFLNQRLFEYPRQPTIRVIKKDEIGKYLRKPFLRKKIRRHLYHEWLAEEL